MQETPIAADQRNGALIAGKTRERTAALDQRKAQTPRELGAGLRLPRNFVRNAAAVTPWHRDVVMSAKMLCHAGRHSSGDDRFFPGPGIIRLTSTNARPS